MNQRPSKYTQEKLAYYTRQQAREGLADAQSSTPRTELRSFQMHGGLALPTVVPRAVKRGAEFAAYRQNYTQLSCIHKSLFFFFRAGKTALKEGRGG